MLRLVTFNRSSVQVALWVEVRSITEGAFYYYG